MPGALSSALDSGPTHIDLAVELDIRRAVGAFQRHVAYQVEGLQRAFGGEFSAGFHLAVACVQRRRFEGAACHRQRACKAGRCAVMLHAAIECPRHPERIRAPCSRVEVALGGERQRIDTLAVERHVRTMCRQGHMQCLHRAIDAQLHLCASTHRHLRERLRHLHIGQRDAPLQGHLARCGLDIARGFQPRAACHQGRMAQGHVAFEIGLQVGIGRKGDRVGKPRQRADDSPRRLAEAQQQRKVASGGFDGGIERCFHALQRMHLQAVGRRIAAAFDAEALLVACDGFLDPHLPYLHARRQVGREGVEIGRAAAARFFAGGFGLAVQGDAFGLDLL